MGIISEQISEENLKLRDKIRSLSADEALKLKTSVAEAYLKKETDGHIKDGKKTVSFKPHQLAEINTILYQKQ